MTTEEYQHRGYRTLFYRQGEAWCIEIYSPGSNTCELVVSYSGAEAITGDTKDRGKADGLFVNTAGIGRILVQEPVGPAPATP